MPIRVIKTICPLLVGLLIFELYLLRDDLTRAAEQLLAAGAEEKRMMGIRVEADAPRAEDETNDELELADSRGMFTYQDEHRQQGNDKRRLIARNKSVMKLEVLDALGSVDHNVVFVVKIGSNVNVDCVVLSDTHGQQEWYYGLHTSVDTLHKSNDSSRIEVKAKGEWNDKVLKIRNVTEKDEGWYTCVVQNPMGYTFSSTYLQVESLGNAHTPEEYLFMTSYIISVLVVGIAMIESMCSYRDLLIRYIEWKARMKSPNLSLPYVN